MKVYVRRTVAVLTAAVLSAGIFAGCGRKTGDKTKDGRTLITVGNWPAQKGKELDRANEQKAEFEKANPDVVVEPDLWTFDIQTFYAKATGGKLPGIYNTAFFGALGPLMKQNNRCKAGKSRI